MHQKNIITGGKKIEEAKKALILVHGRGATAENILELATNLNVMEYAWMAPQATNYTWYPYSFLMPRRQNEPWLSSALELLNQMVHDINKAGIASDNIYFVGFSQGACLTLEFVTRQAKKWGGVAACIWAQNWLHAHRAVGRRVLGVASQRSVVGASAGLTDDG